MICFFYNCNIKKKQLETLVSSNTIDGKYKIIKIDSMNSFYFILCEKDVLKYKIVSKKVNNYNYKISVGNYYSLSLKNFPDYTEKDTPLTGYSSSQPCIALDSNTNVCKEKEIVGIFTSKNLKGLNYIGK